MKKQQNIFKVLQWEYMNCSVNGNPKKRLVLEDRAGNVYIATTATDALCGYYGYVRNREYLFTYHYARTSCNMVIDYMEDINA